MQWNYLDLLAAERQRELLADSERFPQAVKAERVPMAPAGPRAVVWSLGRALVALGRKLERSAGSSEAGSEPSEPTGAFV